jgi:hypothetical protein
MDLTREEIRFIHHILDIEHQNMMGIDSWYKGIEKDERYKMIVILLTKFGGTLNEQPSKDAY